MEHFTAEHAYAFGCRFGTTRYKFCLSTRREKRSSDSMTVTHPPLQNFSVRQLTLCRPAGIRFGEVMDKLHSCFSKTHANGMSSRVKHLPTKGTMQWQAITKREQIPEGSGEVDFLDVMTGWEMLELLAMSDTERGATLLRWQREAVLC